MARSHGYVGSVWGEVRVCWGCLQAAVPAHHSLPVSSPCLTGEGMAVLELPDAAGAGDGHDHRSSLQEPAAAALPFAIPLPVPSQAPAAPGCR